MKGVIPAGFADLLNTTTLATLATLMPDGRPQATPVWFSSDGEDILVNSARGRAKDHNMRRDPRVAVTIVDPENPYRYLEIRGRVTEVTEKGADEHIDALAKAYLNQPKYPFRSPGEVRVKYRITPEHTTTMGPAR
jgi:PPOX class probable F420-dependent enzyme